MMRLGGPLFDKSDHPQAWASAVHRAGYRAAYCPVPLTADDSTINDYAQIARQENIIIAEVGAWSNPLSPDPSVQEPALEVCKRSLLLAEKIGANCCVNIAGSRGPKWDGPYALDLTDETFEMVVTCVREIIDAVKPTRSFYALETMPWMFPDSPDSYLDLIVAIDRPAFGVHLDLVNLICSPRRYFNNTALIIECFQKLGPRIKSCHAKDILLHDQLTTHLDEVRPGLGGLDYRTFLREASQLPQDVPIMLEHLLNEAEYSRAAGHLRAVAREENLEF
jgi:sugar phosphate isomerase/epimerase